MDEQEYQEYIEQRIRERRARRRRQLRARRFLVLLILIICILVGLFFGLYRWRSENPGVRYKLDGKSGMVDVAKEQIGNKGGEPFWSWYGFGNHVEWCACFVSWCANENGYIKDGRAPKFASVPRGVEWFEARDLWVDGKEVPKPGDLIFFDWDGDGYGDHVGLVSASFNGYVFTIEGNSSDMCRRKRYEVGNKCILGYGHIKE